MFSLNYPKMPKLQIRQINLYSVKFLCNHLFSIMFQSSQNHFNNKTFLQSIKFNKWHLFQLHNRFLLPNYSKNKSLILHNQHKSVHNFSHKEFQKPPTKILRFRLYLNQFNSKFKHKVQKYNTFLLKDWN